jgi:hypothetical protein
VIIEAQPTQCPRCRGRMLAENDYYGAFGTCMTCGYVSESRDVPPEDMLAVERSAAEQQGFPIRRRGPTRRRAQPVTRTPQGG